MTLLDRFRRRPAWEHEDPSVRLEGVRELASGEQEILTSLARSDSDARVRRSALKRVTALPVVVGAARADSDEGVREEARACLLEVARGADEAAARTAFGALGDTRSLTTLAKGAAVPALRVEAAGRLADEHALANVARSAEDPAVRREALARVADAWLLLEIAQRTEHKDVAIGAVDRIDDLEALRLLAGKARNGAASRRAAARLVALLPKPEPVAPVEALSEAPATEAATPDSDPVAAPPAAAEAPEPAPPVLAEALAVATPELVSQAAAPAPAGPSAAEVRQAQEKERRERLARIEALAQRLESLGAGASLTLRDADAALREVRIAHADLEKVAPKLTQRVRAARAAVFAKSQPLREAEDWTRWSNAGVQEQLCERVAGLAGREDLEKVALELRECDQRWSEARHAPRDQAEALRQRYQAVRSKLKERLDAFFEKKNQAERENLKRKQALCEQAEALAESTDWVRAAEELKALHALWKEIGPAPRGRAEAAWQRFRTACDLFFRRKQEDLRQRKEQWTANLASKTALIEKAEALAASTDWEAAVAEVKKLQAEWKGIGAVRRSKSEALWERFAKAGAAVFERYKHRDEIAAASQRAEREALCIEIEALAPQPDGSAAPDGLAAAIAALQVRARQATGLPAIEEAAFAARFALARNKLVAAWPAAFKGTDLDPEMNRARKEKLLSRLEALLARAEAAPPDPGSLSGDDLARRLKEALASNTMGGKADADARRKAEADEVESMREAWRRLGPVPGEAGVLLEARFEKACAPFLSRFQRPRKPASRIGAGIA